MLQPRVSEFVLRAKTKRKLNLITGIKSLVVALSLETRKEAIADDRSRLSSAELASFGSLSIKS